MSNIAKLTIVVAACLPHGLQATQAMHAARQFADEHPVVEQQWHEESNTLVLLSVADGAALQQLFEAAKCAEIKHSVFYEPDIFAMAPGYEWPWTAMALEPSRDTRRLCRWLQAAMKG